MIMTDDLVETFLKCPTKCFLRSCGEVGTGNAYADWVRTKNDIFRIEGTKRLVAEVAPDKCAIGAQAMGSLKPAQWHLGIDFAVQSQNLECSCQAVQQIPAADRGRTAQFVPIRFVFRNKLNRDDKLLLAFDARVLSEVLRLEVGFGKIVHGENYATRKVKTSALVGKVRKLTDKIGTLLASPSPPDLGGPGAMSKIYVMKVEDTYRVAGTRISLDSLVYLYREGISPEGMVESYPTLTLEQVHGALAYYLANQKEIDHYLARADAVAETQHQESRRSNAELIAKLRRMRHANQIPG